MLQENTAHFHILYHREDSDFAGEFIHRIEPFYLETCEKASLPSGDDSYDLYICGTEEEFIALTGKSRETYQEWMVGNTDLSRKRLCILSPGARNNRSQSYTDYLVRVILHEVVHIVFDRLCDPEKCEIWLAEGIALYCAGQIDLSYVSETECPRVADISGIGNEIGFADNGGYDYAGVYVWYLIQRYGMEQFLAVYRGECEIAPLIDRDFEQKAVRACKAAHKGVS
ncbi:MAG: hypothetical protein NC432_09580 [Roseburia sp.]|nr:hypothetical protein [Roseburia sp.]MCM1098227.1 hypothetical protein [Ruminococcus flavefaciens]